MGGRLFALTVDANCGSGGRPCVSREGKGTLHAGGLEIKHLRIFGLVPSVANADRMPGGKDVTKGDHHLLNCALERTMLKAPNQVWSMDFVADVLFDERRFRALTVVDNFTKKSLAIFSTSART